MCSFTMHLHKHRTCEFVQPWKFVWIYTAMIHSNRSKAIHMGIKREIYKILLELFKWTQDLNTSISCTRARLLNSLHRQGTYFFITDCFIMPLAILLVTTSTISSFELYVSIYNRVDYHRALELSLQRLLNLLYLHFVLCWCWLMYSLDHRFKKYCLSLFNCWNGKDVSLAPPEHPNTDLNAEICQRGNPQVFEPSNRLDHSTLG